VTLPLARIAGIPLGLLPCLSATPALAFAGPPAQPTSCVRAQDADHALPPILGLSIFVDDERVSRAELFGYGP
jgi:hypothetical protein